jgi:hypothetical protein
MLQVDVNIERSTLSTLGLYPLSEFSTRHRLMATLIREEAAESLLLSIRGDSELAALIEVLNRNNVSWWFKQLLLNCVLIYNAKMRE